MTHSSGPSWDHRTNDPSPSTHDGASWTQSVVGYDDRGGYGQQHEAFYGQPNATGYGYGTPPAEPYGSLAYPQYGYGQLPAPARKSRAGLWIGLAVGTFMLLGIGVLVVPLALGAYAMTQVNANVDDMLGGSTEEILSDSLDVEIGDIVIDDSEYSNSAELSVELHNKGDERATFSVDVEAVSASGERLDSGTAYAAHLAPGQSVTSDVTFFARGDASKSDFADATVKILSVSKY
jgi:hypothetical protein